MCERGAEVSDEGERKERTKRSNTYTGKVAAVHQENNNMKTSDSATPNKNGGKNQSTNELVLPHHCSHDVTDKVRVIMPQKRSP